MGEQEDTYFSTKRRDGRRVMTQQSANAQNNFGDLTLVIYFALGRILITREVRTSA